jgi:hypothetical protein
MFLHCQSQIMSHAVVTGVIKKNLSGKCILDVDGYVSKITPNTEEMYIIWK